MAIAFDTGYNVAKSGGTQGDNPYDVRAQSMEYLEYLRGYSQYFLDRDDLQGLRPDVGQAS